MIRTLSLWTLVGVAAFGLGILAAKLTEPEYHSAPAFDECPYDPYNPYTQCP